MVDLSLKAIIICSVAQRPSETGLTGQISRTMETGGDLFVYIEYPSLVLSSMPNLGGAVA